MALAFLQRFNLNVTLIQAPMAGTSTPELAAAVGNAGAMGSLGLGAASPHVAAQTVEKAQSLTKAALNLNFFCHAPPKRNLALEDAWIDRARPLFDDYNAAPPGQLTQIYASFRDDDAMLEMVLNARPAMASFHFGLPRPGQIARLKQAGIWLAASATSVTEAMQIQKAGLDAVIAQGWSAGGHRGIFSPDGPDAQLSTEDLTRALHVQLDLPVIAAGGLMDGADMARALSWGAVAAQLGTAFIGCPESAADPAYRARLAMAPPTVMTRVISGRPARALGNFFTQWGQDIPLSDIPAYPCAYDLGKALNSAAKAAGVSGFGAEWAGAGASRARVMPAAELVATLARELAESA